MLDKSLRARVGRTVSTHVAHARPRTHAQKYERRVRGKGRRINPGESTKAQIEFSPCIPSAARQDTSRSSTSRGQGPGRDGAKKKHRNEGRRNRLSNHQEREHEQGGGARECARAGHRRAHWAMRTHSPGRHRAHELASLECSAGSTGEVALGVQYACPASTLREGQSARPHATCARTAASKSPPKHPTLKRTVTPHAAQPCARRRRGPRWLSRGLAAAGLGGGLAGPPNILPQADVRAPGPRPRTSLVGGRARALLGQPRWRCTGCPWAHSCCG